ncbi:MAG: hypothetical protein JJU42_06540 [Rhodobacteraceae bacterium]|nr:hypothetical protein [Paracoccaceae bacterium]
MAVDALIWCARHGRWFLVGGLVAGIALPALAEAMRPLIAPMVVFLLFLGVLRLGPAGVQAGLTGLRGAGLAVLMLQLVLPLAAVAVFGAFGWLAHPLALGLVLMLAAAPITGSPNLAILAGAAPAPALRQLVLGTALLPLTALPVFWFIPAFGSPGAVIRAVVQLLGLITLAGGLALALRAGGVVAGGARAQGAMDGLAAVTLGVVVIALMSAVGPALFAGGAVWVTLAVVMAANLVLQIGVSALARGRTPEAAPAMGITAGNRNVALFLGVLPEPAVDLLLLFIGCYQVPMYLTPLLLGGWYRRLARGAGR